MPLHRVVDAGEHQGQLRLGDLGDAAQVVSNATRVPSAPVNRPTRCTPLACSVARSSDEWSVRPTSCSDGSFRAATHVANVVDGPVEGADHVEPPEDVHAAVAPRHAAVAADGERHLAAAGAQLVGELHAGGRRADDEHAAVGELFGTPVRGGNDLVDAGREVTGAVRDRRSVAPPGRDDHVVGTELTLVGRDEEAVAVPVEPLHGGVLEDGASNDMAYRPKNVATSGAAMNPSGSGPSYDQPGRRVIQFGVSRRRESHRSLCQRSAIRPRSRTRWSRPRAVRQWLRARPAWPPPMMIVLVVVIGLLQSVAMRDAGRVFLPAGTASSGTNG